MIPLLRDTNLADHAVLVRTDFNVPLRDGRVEDDTRLAASLPTIRHLLAHNCRVILLSHLGRPQGRVVEELRLAPVAQRLSHLLGQDVRYVPDTVGEEATQAVAGLRAGDVLLLENVQFHPGECANSASYGRALAALADAFVLDAFGQAHRAYASLTQIEQFIPSYAGLLLQKELKTLDRLLTHAERPFIAVLGGAKVSDKLGVIRNLLPKVDLLLIGGAMMFTFLKAQGMETGKSLVEDDLLEEAKALLASGTIVLPVDVVVASDKSDTADLDTVRIDRHPADKMGLDIGHVTIDLFKSKLHGARTILWNGPLGLFETSAFAKGTADIARSIAASDATTVIGGGDTIAAAEQAGVTGSIHHVSTGGGAMLAFLEGKRLPAIAALEDAATHRN